MNKTIEINDTPERPGLTSEQRLDSYARVLGKEATGIVDLNELTPRQRRRHAKKMHHTAAAAAADQEVDDFLGGPVVKEEEGTS